MSQNTNETDEQERIDSAGMPAVGRKKRSGKFLNIAALMAIAGIGLGMAVMSDGDDKKGGKKPKTPTEEIANHLQPLVIPEKPVHVVAAEPIRLSPAGLAGAAPAASPPAALAPAPAPAVKHVLTWRERNMAAEDVGTPGTASMSTTATSAMSAAGEAVLAAPQSAATGAAASALAARMEPSVFQGASASVLPDRNFLIAAGTMLDCIMETRIVSTLPGLIKCHLSRDVYSDNKQVLLMERGTELIGEQSGGIKHGEARMFGLFSRAKMRDGTIININSPATDALGGAGIEGWVDTQFGKRFGAAVMISLLQDATALLVARQSSGNGGQNTLVLGNTTQTGGAMAEKALEASVNIPPILYVNEGAHIQVMLARDLYFPMYALKSTKGE